MDDDAYRQTCYRTRLDTNVLNVLLRPILMETEIHFGCSSLEC